MTRLPLLIVLILANPALAQIRTAPNPFADEAPPPTTRAAKDASPFSFDGDTLPPSYDRKPPGFDERYSETYRQQQAAAQKAGGGCLKYGAAGAVAGHFAGHTWLGALAGCATGAAVRHRDKARIEQQPGQ